MSVTSVGKKLIRKIKNIWKKKIKEYRRNNPKEKKSRRLINVVSCKL